MKYPYQINGSIRKVLMELMKLLKKRLNGLGPWT